MSHLLGLRKKEYEYSLAFGLTVYILFMVVMSVSGFRVGFGTDYFNYEWGFYNGSPGMEPVWRFLNTVIFNIFENYNVFLLSIFFLTFLLKIWVLYKLDYRRGLFLSVMLYCSFYYIAYDINAIRQGLALSITMVACYYTYRKKIKQYIFCMILASLTHYTAIWFIPFYWLVKFHINGKQAILLIGLVFFVALSGIIQDLINISLGIFTNPIIANKIIGYGTTGFSDSTLISFSTLRRVILTLIIIYSTMRLDICDRMKQIIIWGAFASVFSFLLLSEIGYFAVRLSVYYRILECIWISYIQLMFKKKHYRYLASGMMFIYCLLQVRSALALDNNGLEPIRVIFCNL